MADEQEPRIKVVDRRGESDAETPAPKLEIVGGSGAPVAGGLQFGAQPQFGGEAAGEGAGEGEDSGALADLSEEPELSPEEAAQLEAQFESEQFAQIEAQMGRPLTEREKVQVRAEMETQARQMAALEVAPLLQSTLAEVSARAAIHMGLMPNPYTRLIARNDAQARLAIDAFGALFEVIKPQLPPEASREYARVLNDLRVNFSTMTGQKLGAPGAGPSRLIL